MNASTILCALLVGLMLALAGCGTNPGRCELWTPGYPLCGL